LRLPAALTPLRHRSFAALWGAGLVSNAGSWMETVAVGALIKSTTGRDAFVALAAVAAFLPIGVLSPVGGALADRVNRRRLLIVLNCFEAGVATILAVLAATGRASVGAVITLVLVEGCSAALRIPVLQSLLPDLVPPDELLAGVSLGTAQYNIGRVLGPAMAAVVIALGSFEAAFAVNAVSFFAAVAAVAVVRLPPPAGRDSTRVLARIAAGARAAWAEPGCRAALGLVAVAALLVSPFIALVAGRAGALVGEEEQDVARATGLLTTAQGIGAVTGALLVPTLALRFGRRRMLVISLVCTPVLLTVYAWAPTLWSALAAMTLLGAAYIGVLAGLQAVVQLRAPPAYRGRVVSLFLVALGTLYPLGALWQGLVGDALGLRWATTIGAVGLLAVVAALALLRPTALRALDPRPPPSDELPVAGVA
jgi:MFS family permease